MTEQCDVDLGERVGGRLETSTALTYDNNMDCFTSMSVESGKRIFIKFYVRKPSIRPIILHLYSYKSLMYRFLAKFECKCTLHALSAF